MHSGDTRSVSRCNSRMSLRFGSAWLVIYFLICSCTFKCSAPQLRARDYTTALTVEVTRPRGIRGGNTGTDGTFPVFLSPQGEYGGNTGEYGGEYGGNTGTDGTFPVFLSPRSIRGVSSQMATTTYAHPRCGRSAEDGSEKLEKNWGQMGRSPFFGIIMGSVPSVPGFRIPVSLRFLCR